MELTIGQKAPITGFVDSTGKTFSLLGKKNGLIFLSQRRYTGLYRSGM